MTTPKEEGLKPCPFPAPALYSKDNSLTLKHVVAWGNGEWFIAFKTEEEALWLRDAINEKWNHRPATEEQRLRELLQELWDWKESDLVDGWFRMAYAHGSRVTYEYSVKIEDMNARIKAALSNAPAPESERHTQ